MGGIGRLIVFEGVEGCGKTTQLRRSQQWLQSLPELSRQRAVVVTREPGGTELGLGLRRLLLEEGARGEGREARDGGASASTAEEELALLANPRPSPLDASSLNGGNPRTRLAPPGPCSIAELLLFAADRAQHVEQVLKPQLGLGAIILCDRYTDSTIAYQGFGRGMSRELIEQINMVATGGLQSDLTILLDIDPEISLKRKLALSPLDRIEQTDLAFHHRVRNGYLTLASIYPDRIVVVNAARSIDEISLHIQSILNNFIQI